MKNALEIGKAGEHLVCVDLILKGYRAFLSDQGLPYDVLVDYNGKIIKIQVKSTLSRKKMVGQNNLGYNFNFSLMVGKNKNIDYDENLDIFAFVSLEGIYEIGYVNAKKLKNTSLISFRCSDLKGQYVSEIKREKRQDMYNDYISGIKQKDIAKKYEISRKQIYSIIKDMKNFNRKESGKYLSDYSFEDALKECVI